MNYANELAEELTLERVLKPMGLVMAIHHLLNDEGASVGKLASAYSKFSNKGESTPSMLIYAERHIQDFIDLMSYDGDDASNARSYVINKIWARKAATTGIFNPEIALEYQRLQGLKSLQASTFAAVNRAVRDVSPENLIAFKQGMQCMADLFGADQFLKIVQSQWN